MPRFLLIVLFLLCAVFSFTQEQPAVAPQPTIAGKVLDSKGSPIPGATVRISSGETSLAETLTDLDGSFHFNGLPEGKYQVAAEIVGFAKTTKDLVDGTADSSRSLALQLEALPRPPRPKIQTQPAKLETQLAKQQEQPPQPQQTEALEAPAFQTAQVTDLPGLSQFSQDIAQEMGNGTAANAPQENRLFISGNSASIDAGNFNDAGFRNQMMDAARVMGFQIQEFNPGAMDSGMAISGPGGAGGGMMGGGPGGGGPGGGGPGGGGMGFAGMGGRGGRGAGFSQPFIQGSLSENYSNSALNARNYSLTGQTIAKPVQIQNSYSLTLGGRLSFIKYQGGMGGFPGGGGGGGRGGGPAGGGTAAQGATRTGTTTVRTSSPNWSFSYNGSRNRNATSTLTTVPTDLERLGDFSQTYTQSTVIDPGTGFPTVVTQPVKLYLNPYDPSSQFSQIPSIDPIAAQLIQYIPRSNSACAPNAPCTRNYILERSRRSTSDQYQGSISGLRLTSRVNFSVNYSMRRNNSPNTAVIPILDSNSKTSGQNIGLRGNLNLMSRLVANWSVSLNRNRTESANAFSYNNDVEGALGITGISKDPINWGPPTIRLSGSGYQGISLASPSINQSQTISASSGINKIGRKHSIRGGVDANWAQRNSQRDSNGRGTFTFTGYATVLLDGMGRQISGTGNDFADFLIGLPYSTSRSFVDPDINPFGNSTYLRNRNFSAYLMDDWRWRSNLTINYGIRYEYAGPGFEKYNRLVSLDAAPGFTDLAQVFPNQTGPLSGQRFSRSLVNADRNNVAPRVGIAWRPTNRSPFVFRAGYGIGYNSGGYMSIVSQISNQSPFALTQNLATDRSNPLTLRVGFPTDPTVTIPNTFAIDPNYKLSYAQQWNLDIQTQLLRLYSVNVTYEGAKGTQLDIQRAPNRSSNSNYFVYLTNGGNSIYHGLSVQISRRYSRGVNVTNSYTLSKTIDTGSGIAQNDADLAGERGLSSQDRRHNFQTSFNFELPIGQNRMFFATASPKLLNFIAGWAFNGSLSISSGSPLTARYSSSSGSTTGAALYNSLRPDVTGLQVSIPKSERTVYKFFNTAAFAIPAGQFGTASRSSIPGPGSVQVNLSVRKSFNLDDSNRRAELSWQVQNLFNHPNWGGVSTTLNSLNFGQVTSMRGMRSMSMRLNIRF